MEILKSADSAVRPLLSALAGDSLITATGSLLVGSVAASLWPMVVGWAAGALLLCAIARRLYEYGRERRRASAYTAFELALRQPDSDALARVHAANEHFLVFGRVIEVLPHYSLNSRARFASLGWTPDEIAIHFQNESFDASEILARVGGMKSFDPPNGRKFCLTDRSLGGTDAGLSLHVKETDYFTHRSVIANLPFSLRAEFGSLDPAKSRIPHSLCLQFIVRCDDGSVLMLLNETRKAYAGGTWSVSAEEQLNDEDLSDASPLLALFRRAVLEEVFGLSDKRIPLSTRWDQIKEHVRSVRIWSIFVEEHYNNFDLLGVCQLSLNPTKLRNVIRQLSDNGSAARDLEGKIHFTSREQLELLLIRGSASATGLFSDERTNILAENLHWTSRYRMFRLLRALSGKPLAPPIMA